MECRWGQFVGRLDSLQSGHWGARRDGFEVQITRETDGFERSRGTYYLETLHVYLYDRYKYLARTVATA